MAKRPVLFRPEQQAARYGGPYDEWRGRRRIIWSHEERYRLPAVEQIVLGDGASPRPTFDGGALRIQVLPRAAKAGPVGSEVELTFAVDVEPRFNWNRLVSIRVEQAKGILAERLGMGIDDALALLRQSARAVSTPLDGLAAQVISERKTPAPIVLGLAREKRWRAAAMRELSEAQRENLARARLAIRAQAQRLAAKRSGTEAG